MSATHVYADLTLSAANHRRAFTSMSLCRASHALARYRRPGAARRGSGGSLLGLTPIPGRHTRLLSVLEGSTQCMRSVHGSATCRSLASQADLWPAPSYPLPRSSAPFISLERGVLQRRGHDEDLWQQHPWAAQSLPDLPEAWGGEKGTEGMGRIGPDEVDSPAAVTPQPAPSTARLTARCVSCQTRLLPELRSLLARAARGEASLPEQPGIGAEALLVVSGSDPRRTQLGGARLAAPDSLVLLSTARRMREAGELARETELWAVANPMLPGEGARAAAKASEGAVRILTQPPLLWGPSQRWLEQIRASSPRLAISLGVPCASSRKNLDTWFRLCHVGDEESKARVLASFPADDSDASAVLAWNAELVRRALDSGLVDGLHVMPIDARGRAVADALWRQGVFGAQPAARARA